jgi:hypothetical protein
MTNYFKVVEQMWLTLFLGSLQATTSILFLFFCHLGVAESLYGPFDGRGWLDYLLFFFFLGHLAKGGGLLPFSFSFGKNIEKPHELTSDFRIAPSIFKCTNVTRQTIKVCQKTTFIDILL